MTIALTFLFLIGCGKQDKQKPSEVIKPSPQKSAPVKARHAAEKESPLKHIPGSRGWTVTLKTKQGFNTGLAAAVSSSGQIFVGGRFGGKIDFDPSDDEDIRRVKDPGEELEPLDDGFVTSYDAAGRYLWTKTISGPSVEDIADVVAMSDGGVVVIGDSYRSVRFPNGKKACSMDGCAFVLKLSSSGEYEWSKVIDGPLRIKKASGDASKRLYMVGLIEHNSDVDFDPGEGKKLEPGSSGRAFVLVLDKDGEYIFHDRFGHSRFGAFPTSVAALSIGGIVVGGSLSKSELLFNGKEHLEVESEGVKDGYIRKYDSRYTLQFEKAIPGFDRNSVRKVVSDDMGNFVLFGEMDCEKTYKPVIKEKSVVFDLPSEIENTIYNCPGYGGSYILALSKEGRYVKSWPLVSETGSVRPEDVVVSPDGSMYVAVNAWTKITSIPDGPEFHTQTEKGRYVIKIDKTGKFLWLRGIGEGKAGIGDIDNANGLAVGPDGSIIVTGNFKETADFDPGPARDEHTAQDQDIFITKLMPEGYYYR